MWGLAHTIFSVFGSLTVFALVMLPFVLAYMAIKSIGHKVYVSASNEVGELQTIVLSILAGLLAVPLLLLIIAIKLTN